MHMRLHPPETDNQRRKRVKNQRLRERYPALFAFGEGPHKFFSTTQCKRSSAARRIRSVWPYIVRESLAFVRTLNAREEASHDVEDVLIELWMALRECDSNWDPARGRYMSYAAQVIKATLANLRPKTKVFGVPKNANFRVKEYAQNEEALSECSRETYRKLRKAIAPIETLNADAEATDESRMHDASYMELIWRSQDRLATFLKTLEPRSTLVLQHSYGLDGATVIPSWEISSLLNCSKSDVDEMRIQLIRKARQFLGVEDHEQGL